MAPPNAGTTIHTDRSSPHPLYIPASVISKRVRHPTGITDANQNPPETNMDSAPRVDCSARKDLFPHHISKTHEKIAHPSLFAIMV